MNSFEVTKHLCHWPTCNVEVPPKMWGCKKHWFMLPLKIRQRIWATYRPGQEIDKKPSEAYLEAAMEAREFALQNPNGVIPRGKQTASLSKKAIDSLLEKK